MHTVSAKYSTTTVSAVIPTYNRRAYLRRAIDSALAQTVPLGEIIVVDDGSTDGSAEALQEWYGSRVKVVKQEQAGVSGARRRGIREAKGDWIAFLDSDDEWRHTRNGELLQAAAQLSPDVAWVFGDMEVINDQGSAGTLFGNHHLELARSPHVFDDSLAVQFPFQFCMLQASLIRRSALIDCDCFSEPLRSDDDLLAGFKIACRYRFAAIPNIVGSYYRTSDLAASSVVVNGLYSADHFRSRMMSFAAVIESGRRQPWDRLYASEVRDFYKMLAQKGDVPRSLAFQQFRYGGYSLKGFAFLAAALLGRKAIERWVAVAETRRMRPLVNRESQT